MQTNKITIKIKIFGALIINVKKNRNIFSPTVLLYNYVPMEIVSELLDHSNIAKTEDSYGKAVKKKESVQVRRLDGKLTF